jgi:hypothetical protein
MERIEYRDIVNKADWQRGPWDNEPDKIQWQDEATGLPCLIVRGPVGALCGYVGVPSGHPLHGKDYDDARVDVHGGLTFAHGCAEITREVWEKWRERLLSPKHQEEAKRYPHGDAANRLKEWAEGLNSYEAWSDRAHARHVCHLPSPGEPDNVWWLGFDCAHLGDVCPSMDRHSFSEHGASYKSIAYVTAECRSLAAQLHAPHD